MKSVLGVSHWTDDRIGEFSITYTKAGGVNAGSDGLFDPVGRFKNIQNWAPIRVDDVLESQPDEDEGGRTCFYDDGELSVLDDGKLGKWICGIPQKGKSGFDLSNDIANNKKGFAPGQGWMHIVQHQKPNPSMDPFSLEVWIKDANLDDIGFVYPAKETKKPLQVKSKLSRVAIFKTGAVDAAPITITLGDDKWSTNNKDRCRVGDYDGGMRQMDCSYDCKYIFI